MVRPSETGSLYRDPSAGYRHEGLASASESVDGRALEVCFRFSVIDYDADCDRLF